MKILLLNLTLMALWVASTGVFTYANAALGFVVGFLSLRWVRPMLGPTAYFRKLPLAIWVGLLFLWEVLKSNLRVAGEVVTPKRFRHPGIVAVPLDSRTELEISVLANMITLTPGSLYLDLSEDRKTLYVHSMFADDPEQVRRDIKQRFERRVLALLR